MQSYEIIREIFNKCSGNQMRDIFYYEVDIEDPDEYVKHFCVGTKIELVRHNKPDGGIVYDINIDGVQHRMTFSEI